VLRCENEKNKNSVLVAMATAVGWRRQVVVMAAVVGVKAGEKKKQRW
jgi:hypothetical protein